MCIRDRRKGLEHALATGANIYQVAQRRFDAIPGAPWSYWVSENVRGLFAKLPRLEDSAKAVVGCFTCDNFRFIRLRWEPRAIGAFESKWVPYMKGGNQPWIGNHEFVVNFDADGEQIRQRRLITNQSYALPGEGYYFHAGIVIPHVGSGRVSSKWLLDDFIFDTASMAFFPSQERLIDLLGICNSTIAGYLLGLINPTINVQKSDIEKLPLPTTSQGFKDLESRVSNVLRLVQYQETLNECTFDFIAVASWSQGTGTAVLAQTLRGNLERQIDDEVYKLYGIDGEDRAAIEAELAGGTLVAEDDEPEDAEGGGDGEEIAAEASLSREELAVRWISYAVGVVLGRFQPGITGALGRVVYKREDFAVGSLPAPDAAEFDLLVGAPERFAYVDAEGGRHVFSAEAEQALRDLAVPDGVTVLDEGHPRDLPALVERALALMLGEAATDEVVRTGAGGDLRKFLSKDYFTDWHFKWYRKRPVYWPLQSAKHGYGFIVFHERIEQYTLYNLLRGYLDYRITRLQNQIDDLSARRVDLSGRELKRLEREITPLEVVAAELKEFSKTMERIANDGYQPEANWIDDGVILRLAPLWELLPIWKTEPKKHWERLEAGDFDWSHIAMHYWPDRAREKCRTNKSFAIAHGHEEWYEGVK